jgi:hypothetical protein
VILIGSMPALDGVNLSPRARITFSVTAAARLLRALVLRESGFVAAAGPPEAVFPRLPHCAEPGAAFANYLFCEHYSDPRAASATAYGWVSMV